jgi:hypothetical protein
VCGGGGGGGGGEEEVKKSELLGLAYHLNNLGMTEHVGSGLEMHRRDNLYYNYNEALCYSADIYRVGGPFVPGQTSETHPCTPTHSPGNK